MEKRENLSFENEGALPLEQTSVCAAEGAFCKDEDENEALLRLLSAEDPLASLLHSGKKKTECAGKEAFIRGEDLFFGKNGVNRDHSLAASYYDEAVHSGYLPAYYALAVCYLEGLGVPQCAERALELLRGATKSESDACYLLGKCYLEGVGADKNPLLAVFWLREAVRMDGHCLAEKLLVKAEEEKSLFLML